MIRNIVSGRTCERIQLRCPRFRSSPGHDACMYMSIIRSSTCPIVFFCLILLHTFFQRSFAFGICLLQQLLRYSFVLVTRLGTDPCHLQLEILVLVVVVYKVDTILLAGLRVFRQMVTYILANSMTPSLTVTPPSLATTFSNSVLARALPFPLAVAL